MWGYCNFMALEYFKWNKTNRFLWIFCEAKTLLRKVYIFWPLKYNARLFSYFCLWFYFHCMYSLVKKKNFHTKSSSWAPDGIFLPTKHLYLDSLQIPQNTWWKLKYCNPSYSVYAPNRLLAPYSLFSWRVHHPPYSSNLG